MHKIKAPVVFFLVGLLPTRACRLDQLGEQMLKEAIITDTNVAFAVASTIAPVASPYAEGVLPDPDREHMDAIHEIFECVLDALQVLEHELDSLKANVQAWRRFKVEKARSVLDELRGDLKVLADRSFTCGNWSSPLETVINSCSCSKFFELFARSQDFELQAGASFNSLHFLVMDLLEDYRMQAMLPVLRASISGYSGVLFAIGLLSENERAWKHRLTACSMVNGSIAGEELCPNNTCQLDEVDDDFQDFVNETILSRGFDMLGYLVSESTAQDRLYISDLRVEVDVTCKHPDAPVLDSLETTCFVDCASVSAAGLNTSNSVTATRAEECTLEYVAGFPSHPHKLGSRPWGCSCKWCPEVDEHETLCGTCSGYRTCSRAATLDPLHHKIYQELIPSLNLVAMRINICTCSGGQRAIGDACPSYRGQELCVDCDDGYELSPDNTCHLIPWTCYFCFPSWDTGDDDELGWITGIVVVGCISLCGYCMFKSR
mmetsp:Transcript_41745/g.75793  ORF Transcript_41745/g.75793 Transcript_41745/m.75793 type:complete len:490 (-) Transcript_41745:166-1635(-)